MEFRILTRCRVASIFAPCLYSLSFDVCSVVAGALSLLYCNNNSKQQQSQPNIFAVTVIVVALGRTLHYISFPAAS